MYYLLIFVKAVVWKWLKLTKYCWKMPVSLNMNVIRSTVFVFQSVLVFIISGIISDKSNASLSLLQKSDPVQVSVCI